jgi:CDP-4-dehydro-6-deoxyglucose reductase/3-phenylpropionate/trans-cinnamate dioxygenase ferredoxin reductase subunit
LSFAVAIAKQGITFDCGAGETILDAVERAGYSIPYSCRKGVCSSCEGRLLSGQAMVRGQGLRSGPADAVLFCQARPITDVEIAPVRIRKQEPFQRRTFAAKVWRLSKPAPDVTIIRLRLPIGRRAIFRAGQYLRVLMADGDSRNYSMANGPHRNDELELHIRHVKGGKFSESRLAGLCQGEVLDIELPYGEFSLNQSDRKAILIATGTGFAPVKSLIEAAIRSEQPRPLHLYWGANTDADVYLRDLPQQWAEQYPWFTFTPVVSMPSPQWAGRTGFVHAAVLDDYPAMADVEVYACGAPAMIAAAQQDFIAKSGLPPDAFFSDAFVPSGDAEAEAPTKRDALALQ